MGYPGYVETLLLETLIRDEWLEESNVEWLESKRVASIVPTLFSLVENNSSLNLLM